MNACNQSVPLPPVLENHWWLNNSFYHRPFSCCLLSDEMFWFPLYCAERVSSAFGRAKLPDSWRCLQLLCPLTIRPPDNSAFSHCHSLFYPNLKQHMIMLWKWAQAHSLSQNRLECHWSPGIIVLKYHLNVRFLASSNRQFKDKKLFPLV